MCAAFLGIIMGQFLCFSTPTGYISTTVDMCDNTGNIGCLYYSSTVDGLLVGPSHAGCAALLLK